MTPDLDALALHLLPPYMRGSGYDWYQRRAREALQRHIAAAAELLRAAGWTCKPPTDPNASCSLCGKPADKSWCSWAGCPIGNDQ
jgi:hypothetical protein